MIAVDCAVSASGIIPVKPIMHHDRKIMLKVVSAGEAPHGDDAGS